MHCHHRFVLDLFRVNKVGAGLVGQALIAQISDLSNHLLKVVLIAKSKEVLLTPDYSAIELPLWKRTFRSNAKPYSSFRTILTYLEQSPIPVIVVDCTASDSVPQFYSELLQAGINIATPNKRGFSGPFLLWEDISTGADTSGAMVYNESTVGAGLPIISTLKDLIGTGDTVTKIEGIFSGTLSYIFNVFGSGDRKFSDVVKDAKENGYTEPDPRDDLNGMDVGRKLTILSRTVGLEIEGPPTGFPIESLIPKALETVTSGDEFVAGLPAHDAEFDTLREKARSSGQVLRYVGSIDVASRVIKVGLETYGPEDGLF